MNEAMKKMLAMERREVHGGWPDAAPYRREKMKKTRKKKAVAIPKTSWLRKGTRLTIAARKKRPSR